MTADEKILKLVDITSGTSIDAKQLATLLELMGKLSECDVTKVVWTAIGTANALSCIKSNKRGNEHD